MPQGELDDNGPMEAATPHPSDHDLERYHLGMMGEPGILPLPDTTANPLESRETTIKVQSSLVQTTVSYSRQ